MNMQTFGAADIKAMLPHREPFLFVDQASVNGDLNTITSVRRFAPEEPYFPGHFPDEAIVPGVLLLECMAQSAHVLLCLRAGRALSGYLIGVEAATFNDFVRPPAIVTFETKLVRELAPTDAGQIFSFRSRGLVNGKRCARTAINIYVKASPVSAVHSEPASPDQPPAKGIP